MTAVQLTVATENFFVIMVRAAIDRGELPPSTDVRTTVGLLASILWGVGLYSGLVEDADTVAAISNRVDEMLAYGLPGPGCVPVAAVPGGLGGPLTPDVHPRRRFQVQLVGGLTPNAS